MKGILIVTIVVLSGVSAIAQNQKGKVEKVTRERADSLFSVSAFKLAIPVYEALSKKPDLPNPANLWFRLGVCHQNIGDLENALRAYKEAEKINARLPFLALNMARVYSRKGEISHALQAMDSAIAAGFGNYKTVANNPDFENLRKDPGYETLVAKLKVNSAPCESLSKAREFDFWIGNWDVYLTANRNVKAGENRITKMSSGCVLLESWEASTSPHNRVSINYFDTATSKWQQKWSGSGQDVVEFYDGEFTNGMMRFKWNVPNPATGNPPLKGRLSFTKLDGDEVRQHSEQSQDDGKTWQTVYDFTYVRKK